MKEDMELFWHEAFLRQQELTKQQPLDIAEAFVKECESNGDCLRKVAEGDIAYVTNLLNSISATLHIRVKKDGTVIYRDDIHGLIKF